MARRRKRLDPAAFDLPVEAITRGRFTHPSALLSRDVLAAGERRPVVTVQFVADRAGVVAGLDESIAVLRLGVDDWGALTVHALYDGDRVEGGDAVMTVEGELHRFAHLASLCVGVLARRTRVCTNARLLSETARPKPVLALPALHDHFLAAFPGDSHAAQVGGALLLSGLAHPGVRNQPPLLLVPHALVAAHGGDTVAAIRACVAHAPPKTELVVPVDYENDAVETARAVARAQVGRVWGVQLATSEHLVDRSIIPMMGAFPPAGVSPQLAWNVREALDAEGAGEIRIVVSGTFTAERIRRYEEDGVPVDAYGVGAALNEGVWGFHADVVTLDGEPHARVGFGARPNPKLERVR